MCMLSFVWIICCYLDNDKPGLGTKAKDCSGIYQLFKDFND